ncbi:MAG TPA: carbohydrate-binding family 9-like protein [Myxococcota bacterium]
MSQLSVLVVPRISARVPIDGDLAKAPWTGLAPVPLAPSHGRDPGNASRSVQPTALRVCHDGARLYVAFDCADRDVWGSYRGRNERIYDEEVVEAFLAPSGDPRRYFELESSPRGAYWEGIIDNPDGRRSSMRTNLDWECAGWQRGIRVRGTLDVRDDVDDGWSVEWAIPFAALGAAPPRAGERWRANFYRIDQANGGEYSAWAPTLAVPPEFHAPDRFGVLEFA